MAAPTIIPYSSVFYTQDPTKFNIIPLGKLKKACAVVPGGTDALLAAFPGLKFYLRHSLRRSDSNRLIPSEILEELNGCKDPLVMRVCQQMWKLTTCPRIRILRDVDSIAVSSPLNIILWTEEGLELRLVPDDDNYTISQEENLAFQAISDVQLATRAWKASLSKAID